MQNFSKMNGTMEPSTLTSNITMEMGLNVSFKGFDVCSSFPWNREADFSQQDGEGGGEKISIFFIKKYSLKQVLLKYEKAYNGQKDMSWVVLAITPLSCAYK